MRGVSVLFSIAICTSWASAQFLNNRPFPTYSLENMPETEFTCRDKILGGYYADAQTQCQMFHICVKVAGVGIQDFRFLCPNGTAFDQDHQICADWEDVDCDATTLYYSSDNFDLYRIGSGLESKAVKYGEDEETFALQRAETGDTRLNHEHQSSSVNQQKEQSFRRSQTKQPVNYNNNNNNNNEREIFRGSSSSNFFNNRNNGKETDEDYDDNVNVNQNRDNDQRKKVNRVTKQRRPQARGQTTSEATTSEAQTRRPSPRPSTFVNNFAGSSYVPTTSRPTTSNDQYTASISGRSRNGQRRQNQAEERARQEETNPPSTTYSSSTPAPFRQTQQYNTPPHRQSTQNNDNGQYYTSTTQAPRRDTEIYTQSRQKQTTPYEEGYDTPKVKPSKAETYPTTPSKNYDQNVATKKTIPFSKTENYPSNNPLYFDKKSTTPIKQTDNYPTTTLPPKPKPFSVSNQPSSNFPTTFAPRTNAGFTQIIQQTEQYNKPSPSSTNQQYTQKSTPQFTSTTSNQQYNSPTKSSTPKTTSYTQYTPTVPKISTTTPVSRSSRFDETEYDHDQDDDRSHGREDIYNDKKEDEFLRTAHSQNIAASRNEFAKTTKQQPSTLTPTTFESPRPFSVTSNTPKSTTARDSSIVRVTNAPKETPRVPEPSKKAPESKKTKDASYDYAYYDTNPNSEPEYDIDTELKKSTVRV